MKVKVKYETTIYNKEFPFGKDKIQTATGQQVDRPEYLRGCYNGYIFIKTAKGIIHAIEKDRVLELNGVKAIYYKITDNMKEKILNGIYATYEEADNKIYKLIEGHKVNNECYDYDVVEFKGIA